MTKITKIIPLLIILIGLINCEEWYMPNSNMISDKEFPQKIKEDKQSFKFVKYFTPHCPYCRYLKNVFDILKVKKEWCFKIYDFNCQWYNQFCQQNVRGTSFPYTAIHNDKGELIQEIHGFYPEPVVLQIFQRIDMQCRDSQPGKYPNRLEEVKISSLSAQPVVQEAKKVQPQPAVQVPKNTVLPAALDAMHEHVKNVHEMAQKIVKQESERQEKGIPPKVTESKPFKQNQKPVQTHQKPSGMPKYLGYAFYACCILVAALYIYSLHSTKEGESHPPLKVQSPESDSEKPKVQQSSQKSAEKKGVSLKREVQVQENELLQIPDEQL